MENNTKQVEEYSMYLNNQHYILVIMRSNRNEIKLKVLNLKRSKSAILNHWWCAVCAAAGECFTLFAGLSGMVLLGSN